MTMKHTYVFLDKLAKYSVFSVFTRFPLRLDIFIIFQQFFSQDTLTKDRTYINFYIFEINKSIYE